MNLKKYALGLLTLSLSANSLPIDWSGSVGFDTQLLKNVRGVSGTCSYAAAGATGDGSQCIKDDTQHARFQTMLLKLKPTIIVNDSTSIKGELSTGTTRGLFLGEEQKNNNSGSYFSANEGGSTLNINQLYAELYADTAIYKVGKFAKNFGLGAVINSGDNAWDRFYSAYNGIEANFRLGNLSFIPTWAKISTGTGATSTEADPSGKYDVTESSFQINYNNPISSVDAGVLYAKRKSQADDTLYTSKTGNNVTLLDLYAKKTWEKFSVAFEAPMLTGEVGKNYNSAKDQSIDARSYIFESTYNPSQSWGFGFNAGMVSGAQGNTSDYEAMYLHSNYQLANIMFRYDLNGFQDTGKNPLSSSINNATYFNFYTTYKTVNWKWTLSFITATADQTAKQGQGFYNHQRRLYSFDTAVENQSDSLGYEVDLGFEYEWNPQINISGFIGYYSLGDYFAFDNSTSTAIETSNILSSGFKLSVNF